MKTITLYVRRNCCLCRAAQDVVSRVQEQYPFEVQVRDVDAMPHDDPRRSSYAVEIPVIEVDGVAVIKHEVRAEALVELVAGET